MNEPSPAALRILDAMVEPAFALADDRRVVAVNGAAEKLLGLEAARARGRLLDELLLVAEPASWAELFPRLASLQSWQGELRGVGDSAQARWVELTARPLDPALGVQPACVLLVARDASREHLLERALSASEDQLGKLAEKTPLLVVVLDERGTVVGFNPAASALTGIPQSEAVGVPYWDLLLQMAPPERKTEEERERIRSTIFAGMHANHPIITGKGPREYRSRDGSRRWVEQIAFIPLAGAQGPRFVSVILDITEREDAERALRESEEKFRTIAEQLSGVIFITDAAGRMVYVSPGIEPLFGLPAEQVVGRAFTDFVPEDRHGVARELFEKLLAGGQPLHQHPLQMRRGDGCLFAAEISSTPWRRGGTVQGTLGLIHDVSERARASLERQRLENQLLQAMKMEAVGRLAGGVAHDFNNYLTCIIGNAQMALLNLPPGAFRDLLLEVDQAAVRAADLTRQLLAFSRKQVIEPRVIDLNELIANLGKMLTRLIGEDVRLQIRVSPHACRVNVDPGQFEQILVNLAVNARDAMPRGGLLAIETSVVELDAAYCSQHVGVHPGAFVRLSVSDTGEGLSPEAKAHLFEPFFTTKGTGKGTGLGLATTYGAVKQAGGQIEVYSEPGQGTSFHIHLPSAAGAPTALSSRAASALVGGHETILLVEDEPLVRESDARLLRMLGYQVVEAADGEQALSRAFQHEGTIDLLLTDVVMPGMNGRELSQRLLALRPGLRVLFASGYTEDVVVRHGVLEAGIHFIGKPHSPAALATKIRDVLGG